MLKSDLIERIAAENPHLNLLSVNRFATGNGCNSDKDGDQRSHRPILPAANRFLNRIAFGGTGNLGCESDHTNSSGYDDTKSNLPALSSTSAC